MEIQRQQSGDCTVLRVSGRLDGYWADHLDREVADTVRSGARNLRLNASAVDFLSSAGIRIMIKCSRELKAIGGSFAVVEPSEQVRQVLDLSGLLAALGLADAPAAATEAPVLPTIAADGAIASVNRLSQGPPGSGRLEGDPASLSVPTGQAGHAIRATRTTIALGLGALGEAVEGQAPLYGEFLAVGGVAVHLPSGQAAAPDYLLAAGEYLPPLHALYGFVAQGEPRISLSFEPAPADPGTLTLGGLASAALEASGAAVVAVAVVAETAGLVGAALKRAPGPHTAGDPFDFPAVRERISFTPERAWPRGLALIAGVAARGDGGGLAAFLRPLNDDASLFGHFHAAAFPYRALPASMGSAADAVGHLFEAGSPQGILHLLRDDRGISGAGESEFVRGIAWVVPVDTSASAGGKEVRS